MRLLWPLTGRSEQMGRVEAAISSPDLPGVVVWGADGSGKSRIARETMALAAARGRQAHWIVGTLAAQPIPLGACTAWTSPDVTDTMNLVRTVIGALTVGSAGGTTILIVDDAHLLDNLSAFVIQQIVQRGAATVLLTVMEGVAIPVAVQEIWGSGEFDHVGLASLSVDDVARLLEGVLDATVDPDAVRRLWTMTRGNVLYLRNIVEQEIEDGRLVRQRGYVQWIGDPVTPFGLAALIESRVGVLPEPVIDVIDVLAVAEPLELAVLQRVTDTESIEHADVRGLIALDSVPGGVEVRLAHPLLGQVRRTRAAPSKLRRLRGLVATALATAESGDGLRIAVRRATLSIDSDLTPDVDLLVKAAHGAVWLADLPLADRIAAAAARVGSGPEPNFVRAHALSWMHRGIEAEEVLAAVDAGGLDGVDRARLAFLRACNRLWALGDPVGAEAIAEAAEVETPRDRAVLDAFRAVLWFATDRPDLAATAARNLVATDLPPVVDAELAWVQTAVAADAGRTSEAVALAEAGYESVVRSFEAPHMRFNIADAHISALLLAGRGAEALALAESVLRQAADLPGAAYLLGGAIAGRAALGAGRLDKARVLLDQAVAGLAVAGYGIGWGYRYGIPRVQVLAMSGSLDEAADALHALDNTRRSFRTLDYDRSLAQAWVSAGQGAVTEAIAILCAAAQAAAERGQFAVEVLCLQCAAQLGDHSGAHRLRELEPIVEGPRVGVAARFASALRSGDAPELSAVSAEFENLGDIVAAADAAAHAALRYRELGLRGTAMTCSARADALAHSCGVVTPALRAAVEPLPLTDREREVVMLVAAGMSNRQVADRLTLSPRTVESHIYRAMAKTGTSSREELIALLSH